MKIRIALGLCVVLGAGSISLRAADNPAQAAARAALVQKLNQPDGPQTQSLPATNTPSEAVVEQPGKSSGSVTETVSEKAVTPQTAPVATAPVAAPAAVAPVPVAPVVVSPVAVAPAAAAPAMSPVILLLVLIALLLIALVVMLILLLKLRALKLLLLKNPAVMARVAEASRSHGSKQNSTGTRRD
ncbi:MAG: hypothetical protein ABSH11_03225 [Verrucomicrobiota bacterium]